MIPAITREQHTAAKVAGISGLISFAIVVFGNYVLLGPLLVAGNATETARNIVAHQTQLRFAIVCFLSYSLTVVVLLTALYLILKPVNPLLATLGAVFRFVFAMLWLVAPLNLLSALRLLGTADYLHVVEPERLQVLARLQIGGTFDDYYVGLPFFGLAATLCAWLWYKSGYIPRSLAAFGVIASAWCVICAFVFLIFPNFNKIVNDYWFDSPMAIFEMVVSVWLLLRGIRAPNPREAGDIAPPSPTSVSPRFTNVSLAL
jgi:Domain of unknown function (DUF4386)